MIRKNFNITEENKKQLEKLHELTGASESEIMRRAITIYYNNWYKHPYHVNTPKK